MRKRRRKPGATWKSPANQRLDYETRLGAAFTHTAYQEELAALRDRLEAALSSPAEAIDTESIVADIDALKAAHTLEAAPVHAPRKAPSVAEAVTTRLMHRAAEAAPVSAQPETRPEQMALPAAATGRTADPVVVELPVQRAKKPKATYQQKVMRDTRQMSLF
jgi:hypothetical protein